MMKRKQSEIYTKILKSIMVGTLACGLVGCAANESEPTQEKEQSNEIENQQTRADYLPKDNMSKEDTKKLKEGDEFSVEEFTQFPDEITLEEQGLTLGYLYQVQVTTVTDSNSVAGEPHTMLLGTQVASYEEFYDEALQATNQISYTFMGVKICKIAGYQQLGDGTWIKTIFDGEYENTAGPVLSQKVIKELNENKK